MPAPGASQIESPASGFLKGAGLQGETNKQKKKG